MKQLRTIRPAAHALAAATFLFAAGCGEDMEMARDQMVVRDSMSVVISETGGQIGSGGAWRVGEEPTLTIGHDLEAPAEYQFASIHGVIRLPEGGVLVGDQGSLREYDENGVHVRTWGARGEGPGEFSFIGGLHGWGPDSVVVWDRGLLRLSVFDTQGNLGRTARMHEAPQLILRGVIGHDQLVFERVVEFNANELLANWNQRAEYEREQGVVEVWDATGSPVGIVGPYPHTEYHTRRSDRYMGPLRYSRRMVVGVWGSLVMAGPNDRYELRAHGPHGSLERIIRLDRSPVSPDANHLRALLEEDSNQDRDIPMAATLPMFDRVIGDDLGYLWVRDYDMPGEDTAWWTVFDGAGAVVTRLETSDRLRVWQIGRDIHCSFADRRSGHPDGGDCVPRQRRSRDCPSAVSDIPPLGFDPLHPRRTLKRQIELSGLLDLLLEVHQRRGILARKTRRAERAALGDRVHQSVQ